MINIPAMLSLSISSFRFFYRARFRKTEYELLVATDMLVRVMSEYSRSQQEETE